MDPSKPVSLTGCPAHSSSGTGHHHKATQRDTQPTEPADRSELQINPARVIFGYWEEVVIPGES